MSLGAELPKRQRHKVKDAEQLKHIEEVSRNARGTWLSLIAVLLFSAIAVAGVRDRDFFTYGAGMALPVINFTVPVKSFFFAGPLIVLGLYTYLHLYLLKLWRALAVPPARLPDGRWLDEAVFPWLVSDAAIALKPGGPKRRFGWLTKLVAILFLWAAGPMILVFFWWRSFPPHDLALTSWIGLLAGLSLIGAAVSFDVCWRTLRQVNGGRSKVGQDIARLSIVLAALSGLGLLVLGVLRTEGTLEREWGFLKSNEGEEEKGKPFYADLKLRVALGRDEWIYSANLYRAELVERPAGWMSRDEAWEDFKSKYSGLKRHQLPEEAEWLKAAEDAFDKQRKLMLDGLKAEDFKNVSFRKADMREAFMPGLDLEKADLSGADLSSAYLEMADLRSANLQEATLWEANLQEATLRSANLQEADLREANLQEAALKSANLQEATLSVANLQEATLSVANLQGADLRSANLQEADLREANLQEATLSVANLQEAALKSANLQEADLREANLQETETSEGNFSSVSLVSVDLSVNSNLTQTQINSAFGDRSTVLSAGITRPPHWPDEKLETRDIETVRQDWLWLRPQREVVWDSILGTLLGHR